MNDTKNPDDIIFNENMILYNMLRSVPEEAKKPITAGRLKGFTDINPMFRIKRLTETFGPCGIGWWYEITDKRIVDDPISKQSAAFIDILLCYVDPVSKQVSKGIPGTGGSSFVAQEKNGPYLSDECFKMALSDAISVAAKALGVCADVYYQKDRDKYTHLNIEAPTQQGAPVPPPAPAPTQQGVHFKCADCGSVITAYLGTNGKTVSVRKHCEGSKEKFGRILCCKCISKGAVTETIGGSNNA